MGPGEQDRRGDPDLVAAALGGDKLAFGVLVGRHREMVEALVTRLMGRTPEVADAVQEAAVAALVGLGRLRTPGRFGAWYAGIALNVARRWIRGGSPTVALVGDWADGQPGPEEAVEARELGERVRLAVASLAPGQRQAVLAFYWSGLSHAEAAMELGVSPGAVKARLHQAREVLRTGLASHLMEEEVSMSVGTEPIWLPMEVAEVRRSKLGETNRHLHVVVLNELGGSRRLPIYVGAPEARALACLLETVEMPRPMTYQLTANLTAAAGARVVDVRVTRLAEGTFYALVHLKGMNGDAHVDARPSDALNLALVCGAPVLVDAAIFDHPGPFRHPEWRTAWQSFPTGTAELAAEVQHQRGDQPT